MTSQKILFLITLWFLIPFFTTAQNTKQQPNFIIIYSDDQRYDAIGCQFEGKALTPNLDALCDGGLYFENAFVTLSICSPSRAALLTGRYGRANGVTTFGKVSLKEGEKTLHRF